MKRKIIITFLLFLLLPLYANHVSGDIANDDMVMLSNPNVKSSLHPLTKFFKQCNKGMKAFIGGENVKTAFSPLSGGVHANQATGQLREELKKSQVTGIRTIVPEFELIFFSKGKPVLYLRTEIMVDEVSAGFFSIDARKPGYYSGKPLDAYTGLSAPFRDSAIAVYKIFTSQKKCKTLPFVSEKYVANISKDAKLKEYFIKTLTRSKQKLDKICATINSLEPDQVRLRLDDMGQIAVNSSGEAMGVIKSALQLFPDGRIGITLNSFRPFKK